MGLSLKEHHGRLASKILALGCNPKASSPETKRKVQSGIFLSKILRVIEEKEEFRIDSQPGHFFKWHDGPKSPSLSETWSEMRDQIAIFGLREIDPPYRQKHCMKLCQPIHFGPSEELSRNGRWAKGLASTAYLKKAGWGDHDSREELREALGIGIETLYPEMRVELHNLGILV